MSDPTDGLETFHVFETTPEIYPRVYAEGRWYGYRSLDGAIAYVGDAPDGPYDDISEPVAAVRRSGGLWWKREFDDPLVPWSYSSDLATWNAMTLSGISDPTPDGKYLHVELPRKDGATYWTTVRLQAPYEPTVTQTEQVYIATASSPASDWVVDTDNEVCAQSEDATGVQIFDWRPETDACSGYNNGTFFVFYGAWWGLSEGVHGDPEFNEGQIFNVDLMIATATSLSGPWTHTRLARWESTLATAITNMTLVEGSLPESVAYGDIILGEFPTDELTQNYGVFFGSNQWVIRPGSGEQIPYATIGTPPVGPWVSVQIGTSWTQPCYGGGIWTLTGDDGTRAIFKAGSNVTALSEVDDDLPVGVFAGLYQSGGEWLAFAYTDNESLLPEYWLRPGGGGDGWGVILS